MTIGERILRRREQLGITQGELAEAADTSQSIVSRLENGTFKNPGADMIRRLSRALAVTSDWLIGMYEEDSEDAAARHPSYRLTNRPGRHKRCAL